MNQRYIGRDAYLAKLQSLDIQARACALSGAGIVLEQSVQITQLPGLKMDGFLYKMNMHSYVQLYCLI